MTVGKRSCREAAMGFLARREHSLLELRNKLLQRDYDRDEIDAQLSQLHEEGLQSDERYAESFTLQRAKNGYGPMRIRQEMQQRGIDAGLIDRMLDAYRSEWLALARQRREKHFGAWPEDMKAKAKQARYLQYRGYDFDIINRIFSGD